MRIQSYVRVGALLTVLSTPSLAVANGFDAYLAAGNAWTHLTGGTQQVAMNSELTNQYTITSSANRPTFAVGAGYLWTLTPDLALNVGFNAHYLKTEVDGVNAPDIIGDTLNYTTDVQSLAFLLTPKLIWTASRWQPYIEGGMGLSVNEASNYSETPTDPDGSAVPTQTPFGNERTDAFAYELGVGIQHALWNSPHAPLLALSYDWMDWGKVALGSFAGQTTSDRLSFGHLQTSSVNASLTWPF